MKSISQKALFTDYYLNNKGTFFKSFKIIIGSYQYNYDIYWGDPNIIFEKRDLRRTCPLAISIIPHRYGYPNSRIFLYEKLEAKYKNVFEVVVAHEVGHLWLHDIVGFNNPSTTNNMNEEDSEMWSDYFAYSFFQKYRNTNNLENFSKIIEEASRFQMRIYNLLPEKFVEPTFTRKILKLKQLEGIMKVNKKVGTALFTHMENAMEITLNSLGDIFL